MNERLTACKEYMRVDFDEDDALITALLTAADGYLTGAGVRREIDAQMYDLVAFDMALRMYDGRDEDATHAATSALARQMLTQLKLRSAYEPGG